MNPLKPSSLCRDDNDLSNKVILIIFFNKIETIESIIKYDKLNLRKYSGLS